MRVKISNKIYRNGIITLHGKVRRAMALPLVIILCSVFLVFGATLMRRGVSSKRLQAIDHERVRAEMLALGLYQLAKIKTSILHTKAVDAVKWYFGKDPYSFTDSNPLKPDMKLAAGGGQANYFESFFASVSNGINGLNYTETTPYPVVSFSVNIATSVPLSRARFGVNLEEYTIKIVIDTIVPSINNKSKNRSFSIEKIIKIRKG